MYAVTVQRSFSARHFLTSETAGRESRPHGHRYGVIVRLEGPRLNADGYLVDIRAVDRAAAAVISRYAGSLLNRLDGFRGHNPSIERLSRLIWQDMRRKLGSLSLRAMTVTVAESARASTSYRSVFNAARPHRVR